MTNAIRAIRERLCDGADLLIDFATLGEYGFEPVETECRVAPCAPARNTHGPARLREAIRRYERAAA